MKISKRYGFFGRDCGEGLYRIEWYRDMRDARYQFIAWIYPDMDVFVETERTTRRRMTVGRYQGSPLKV